MMQPTVEIDEESIAINGTRFSAPPTIHELTNLLGASPTCYPVGKAEGGTIRWNWVWDNLGITASGFSETRIYWVEVFVTESSTDVSKRLTSVDEATTSPTDGYLPLKAFGGSLIVYGIDVKQNGSFERIKKHLTPMDVEFPVRGKDGATETVGGNQLQVRNSQMDRPLDGQPTITFKQNVRLRFQFPDAVSFPTGVLPLDGEQVLGKVDRKLDSVESIKGSIAMTKSFMATVSNRRLIVEIGGRDKLVQWSLNDITNVALRPNVTDLEHIPGAKQGWHSQTIQAGDLREWDRPPYHALSINSRSQEPTTFVFKREIMDTDKTLPRLLNLETCIKNAVSRYHGKVPDLPLKDETSTSSDTNGRLAATAQNQVNDKLVPCPRCTNQVSPQAVNCPFCGEPIAGGLFRINRGTREKTPKFVKVSRPLGWLLLILSGAGFVADMLLGDGTHYVPWVIGACLAICLLAYVEIGQWWHQS